MDKKAVWIDYENHRGERRWRQIMPVAIWWGDTLWHSPEQWLLKAIDMSDPHMLVKDFAISGIRGEWRTTPPEG